jgi:putative ABC transport system substrate-binding protein
MTGVVTLAPDLARRQFELLKEVAPEAGRVAVLWSPDHLVNKISWKGTESAASALGLELQRVEVRSPLDFGEAFKAVTEKNARALLVMSDATTFGQRLKVIDFAAKRKLPAVYSNKLIVEAGGLMSYWATLPDVWKRLAGYVDKILKGAKPAGLPIEQPTKFELVVNLKTAGQIALTIPPEVLKRADKVIK